MLKLGLGLHLSAADVPNILECLVAVMFAFHVGVVICVLGHRRDGHPHLLEVKARGFIFPTDSSLVEHFCVFSGGVSSAIPLSYTLKGCTV